MCRISISTGSSLIVEDQELLLPKGTRIECMAHYDNSANNPANPDPTKEVRWGDQTWEEMMIGWFDVSFRRQSRPDGATAAPAQRESNKRV